MRWDESATCRFVKLYLDQECLWNKYHENYKSKYERTKAHHSIISDFNASTGISLSTTELKSKIKSLKSTYSQEKSKIRERSGPNFTYKPTIKWFSDMHKHFQKLPGDKLEDPLNDDSLEETCQESFVSDIQEEEEDINEEDVQDDKFESNLGNEYLIQLQAQCGDSDPVQETEETYKYKKKKLKHANRISNGFDISKNIEDNVGSTLREDEFDIYGKFIASQLRSMELQTALRLQLQIHSLVSKARRSEISDN